MMDSREEKLETGKPNTTLSIMQVICDRDLNLCVDSRKKLSTECKCWHKEEQQVVSEGN